MTPRSGSGGRDGPPETAGNALDPASGLAERGAARGSPAPVGLRVEDHPARPAERGRALPVALSPAPRLSWTVPLVRQGQAQTAYQVRAWPAGGGGRVPVWDSGRVQSGQGAHVRWGGPPLRPHSLVRWTVRTWDERGVASDWADLAELIAGPFAREDWSAEWIALEPGCAARTTFTLPQRIRRAVVHLAGHGVLRASLDGAWVNPDASDPSRTSLRRAVSRGYDVTHLLSGREHVLGVVAGLGHYGRVRRTAALLAELVAETESGELLRIGTHSGWRVARGSLVREEPFFIEEHDHRIADAWRHAGADDAGWRRAAPASRAPGIVVPDAGPPVCVVERIAAAPLAGRVFDVGRNVAGRSRVVVRGAAPGTRVEIVHGERLDAAGHVDTRNIRLPGDADRERQVLVVHCAGERDEAEAWLTYYGFRYVEVRGLPGDAEVDVTAHVLHSDLPRTGEFATDDPLLDRLVLTAVHGQRNNTHGHPEDCPTREQGGWTGDAAVSAEAAFAHLDMAGVYRNWLADLALDQRPDGGVLSLVPHLHGEDGVQPPDPVWGAAMSEVPVQHWRHVGDRDLVSEMLPAMRRWADWQLATVVDGVVRAADISYGADWLAPERTPPVLLQTAAVIRSLRALAELESAVGDEGAAAARAQQADELAGTARRVLLDPVTGTWANGSQGAVATVLDAPMVTGAERAALNNQLRADMHRRGNRASTGYAATQALLHALGDADGGTAALAAVHQPAQPGIGAMLADGPGTFWETWWTDDDNVGVASLDHIGLAAPFAAWAWSHVAGLRPLTAGYARFLVAPRLLGPVRRVSVVKRTVRGTVRLSWQLTGTELLLRLEVPVGAVAVIDLPAPVLSVDGRVPGQHPNARVTDAGIELAAGSYVIRASGTALSRPAPAIGGADGDVPVGGKRTIGLLVPEGQAPGDARLTIGNGWEARLADGAATVAVPAGARAGETAELVLSVPGFAKVSRTLRAVSGHRWLPGQTPATRWRPAAGSSVRVIDGTWNCAPVYHAPVPGPILEVSGAGFGPGQTHWLRLPLDDEPADLSAASFGYADFDLCFPVLPGHRLRPVIRLTAADGSAVEGTVRPMPACWNRVTVDLAGWPGRTAVAEVAAGLRWSGGHDPARGHFVPQADGRSTLPFRLGLVGWTSAPRTW